MPEAASALRHRGTRAVQRMVEYAPSTGGLALWAHHRDLPATDSAASRIATDGHTVFYGAGFERLPLGEQTGLVAHEVLHIALRHAQRLQALRQLVGDVDERLFNTCADAIVNSALGHLGGLSLPAAAVRLEQLLAQALGIAPTAEAALLAWDVESLYRAVDDRGAPATGGRAERQRGRGREGGAGEAGAAARQTGGPTDPAHAPQTGRADGPRAAAVRALGAATEVDLLPGPAPAGAPEHEADAALAWRERLLRAHAGDGAFSILRALVADLPASRTPWELWLRTRLARSLAPKPEPSWSRPSRSYLANQGRCGHHRLPFEPGYGPNRAAPRLVVVVDVSGSIEGPLLDRFATEVEAITRRLAVGLVLVVGDDRVRHVEHCRPGRSGLREIGFQGGGGTDFTPLLEEADRHRPDIGVVLTDLDGPARFRPHWPVLWAVPDAPGASRAPIAAPFGRRVGLR